VNGRTTMVRYRARMARRNISTIRRRAVAAAATPDLGHLDRAAVDAAIERVIRTLRASGIEAVVYGPRKLH
jgi:hypothetical protein